MHLTFREWVIGFYKASRFQKMVKLVSNKYDLPLDEASDLLGDSLRLMLGQDGRRPLNENVNFEAYLFTVIRNEFINQVRMKVKENEAISRFSKELISENELSPFAIDAEQNRIFQINQDYILEHIEELIPGELNRIIFIDYRLNGKSYAEIYEDVVARGLFQGKLATLRVINNRTLLWVIEQIKQKYPNITTKPITTQNEGL